MSPTTAVLQAVREMERMAQMAETNLIRAMNTLVTRDQKEIDEVYRVEENINFLNKEITNYLVHLNQASLPTSDVMRIGALFHVVNDIERIGDHAENVADSAVQMTNDNVTFSKQGELDLSEMLDMVLKILDESIEMFAKNDLQHLQEIIDIENSIDQRSGSAAEACRASDPQRMYAGSRHDLLRSCIRTRACRGPCNQYCILHSG